MALNCSPLEMNKSTFKKVNMMVSFLTKDRPTTATVQQASTTPQKNIYFKAYKRCAGYLPTEIKFSFVLKQSEKILDRRNTLHWFSD